MSIEQLKHNIGAQIRAARDAKRLTQGQLTEAVNRSVEAISNIERGASLPPLDTLSDICAVCDLTLSDIFDNPAQDQSKHRTELEMSIRMMLRDLDDKQAQLAKNLVSSVWSMGSE